VTFRFGTFELDAGTATIRRDGRKIPVQPRVFAVIRYLLEHRGRVVLKPELVEALWPGMRVDDGALAWTISRARKVLGQRPGERHPIETISRRGYRFVEASVSADMTERPPKVRLAAIQANLPRPACSAAASRDPFLGRSDAMGHLVAALDAACGGRGRLALLTGEPGIGKSRCVSEFAAVPTGRQISVWSGRCVLAAQTAAFWPWVEVFRDALGEGTLEPNLHVELDGLVDDLISRWKSVGARGVGSPRATCVWTLEKLGQLLRRLADAAPRVVIIEDVHLADEASLDLLTFLASGLVHARTLLVATARSGVPSSMAWAKALSKLSPCDRIEMRDLKTADVAEYLAQATGLELPVDVRQAVHVRCGGNPLLLQETARLLVTLAAGNGIDKVHADDIPVPRFAKDALRVAVKGLSRLTSEVLEVACVLGHDFDLALLQSVVGVDAESLLMHLDEATRACLIAPQTRPGSYRFSHGLTRESLYEDLSTSRRLDIHYRIATSLAERAVGDLGVKTVAYHYCRALPHAEARLAEHWARSAGSIAMSSSSYEEAAQFYEWAIEARNLHEDRDPRGRCELLFEYARAVWLSGGITEAFQAAAQAMAIARQHRFVDMLSESAAARRDPRSPLIAGPGARAPRPAMRRRASQADVARQRVAGPMMSLVKAR
jgi:DNA-binding winged helix-turn-helix (wHTH) protein